MDDQGDHRESSDLMYGLLAEAIIYAIKKDTEAAGHLASELAQLRDGIDHPLLRSQALELVWLIFAPTMRWDDVACETDIANRVFAFG